MSHDHLKRQPGETLHHFSSRFNKVYHSMPADIRPPPGLALLHHPDAFDPKMAFQLRERDTATLEEMKNIAVDVEANLLNRKAKLKAVKKDKIEKEHLITSEIKLDILANTVNEVMHKISRKEELVQIPHVPLVPEKIRINVPKHFAAHPRYSRPPNDYFMYSIHNIAKDEDQNQTAVEQSPEMMSMDDDLSYIDDLPEYDHQDDDYMVEIEGDCSKQPTLSSWEEEAQLSQCKDDNQTLHTKHDRKEENAESFQISAKFLPLFLASLLRENYKQVVNRKNEECSNESVEENRDDTEHVLDPEVRSLSNLERQISDEITESETDDEVIQFDYLPLCFFSFQIVKGNLGHILVDNHRRNHEVSVEPIADMLDGLCFQSQASFTCNDFKSCYDMDMIRQYAPLSCSTEVSLQSSSDKVQTCPELFEDMESTCAVPGHEVELTESEYQKYPVAIYMEKLFITEPQYISIISVVFQVYQAPCNEDQDGNLYQIPLADLFLSLVKNSERAKIPDPIFDWLYWIFHID